MTSQLGRIQCGLTLVGLMAGRAHSYSPSAIGPDEDGSEICTAVPCSVSLQPI